MFSRLTTFEDIGSGSKSGDFTPLLGKVAESKLEIEHRLGSAYKNYQEHSTGAREALWEALHLFARRWAADYKQLTLRLADLDGDLISAFTLHAMEKLESNHYRGIQPIGHWLEVVFRNFANTQLADFTYERNAISGLLTDRGIEDAEVEAGYVGESSLAIEDDGKRAEWQTDACLRELDNPAGRAYATFLMQGLNQKQAAVRMEESVVTARKRQGRIEAALTSVEVSL